MNIFHLGRRLEYYYEDAPSTIGFRRLKMSEKSENMGKKMYSFCEQVEGDFSDNNSVLF